MIHFIIHLVMLLISTLISIVGFIIASLPIAILGGSGIFIVVLLLWFDCLEENT